MTNPVNANRAALPSINDPMVDPATGTVSSEWYRWALAMLNRTGGSEGASLTDANSTAQQAYQLSVTANSTANNALTIANNLTSTIGSASAIASGAEADASLALTTANERLAKAANLSDLSNLASARSTLGISYVPLSYSINTFTGQSLYTPIVVPVTIPSLFTCYTYAATPPSADTTIILKIIRVSTAVVTIGTIMLRAGAFTSNLVSMPVAYSLAAGDTLQLQLPTSDAANVGLTIRALLT